MKKLSYLLFALLLAPSQAFGATAAELMAVGVPAAQAVLLTRETVLIGASPTQFDTEVLTVKKADDGLAVGGGTGQPTIVVEDDGQQYIQMLNPNGFWQGLRFNEGTTQAGAWIQHYYNGSAGFMQIGLGGAAELELNSSEFYPSTDSGMNLGNATYEFNDLYIDGTAYIDAVEAGADKPGSDVAASGLFSWTDVSTTVQALLLQATNNANAPLLYFNKTRATDGTANTIVNDNDTLGKIIFFGADGASYREAAWIQAKVNGTPGSGDMPAELSFAVTPDGAASAVEAFRIEQDGDAFLLGPTVTASGQIISTGTSDLGWSVQSAANQACTTTCTRAAVFGFDTGTSTIVGPSDATADSCVCAGGS